MAEIVAPRVGARVEIGLLKDIDCVIWVAPRVGARVEIGNIFTNFKPIPSPLV